MERPTSIAILCAFQTLFGVLQIVASAAGDFGDLPPSGFAYWVLCCGVTNLFSAYALWQLSWLGAVASVFALVANVVASKSLPVNQQPEIPFVILIPVLIYAIVVFSNRRRMHWALRWRP